MKLMTLINKEDEERIVETSNINKMQFLMPWFAVFLDGFPERAALTGVLQILGWIPGIVFAHYHKKRKLVNHIKKIVNQGYFAKTSSEQAKLDKLIK